MHIATRPTVAPTSVRVCSSRTVRWHVLATYLYFFVLPAIASLDCPYLISLALWNLLTLFALPAKDDNNTLRT